VISTTVPVSLRFAMRELRGGLSGFYVLIACIALGVAAIAGVNSVSRALTEGVRAEGRVILGGDLAFSLISREASPDELAYLRSKGRVGQVATMRAMVRRPGVDAQALVELKAVDDAYPHRGRMRLDQTTVADAGPAEVNALLAARGGTPGALAAPELLDRIGAAVGDRILLGSGELEIRGLIATEPDRLSSGVGFGPRLIVSIDALRGTGLVQPGSLITWAYRLLLPRGANSPGPMGDVRAEALERFPEAGWSIRARTNASPGLTRNLERFSQFLTLVGLTALVVGGVGVANAVASFVDLKRPAIATLKCLGARGSTVFQVYLLQILALAGLGILVGLAVGALLPFAAKAALADLVPVSGIGLYPRELALAALYGVLVTLCFALGPLGRAREMPATSLFADRALGSPLRPPLVYRAAQLAAFVALGALAVLLSGDGELALTYIASVVAVFVVLRLVALGIMWIARRAGTIRGTTLRLAVRNIHRPGALTPSVVLSLGLGLTLLVSLALIDTNLRSQLSGAVAERAPDFFFVDIQNRERDTFVDLLQRTSPGGDVQTVPMLRGRFVAVKGVAASDIRAGEDSRWALRGDRGITYSDTVPENSTVVTGEWWPANYTGEPLVSLADDIAQGLGVMVGDEITVNVLGRNVTARVANLRRLDWESLSINFVLVFSPNTFAGAPHSHLATLKLPEGSAREAERAVLSAVTPAFPGVTSVSVRDAIGSVNAIISDLALGIRAAASLALFVSMLVLGGALAAGHRQRRQDAVILKTLGATRGRLLSAFSLEYGLLGLATALFAVAAGSGAAWYVITRVMELNFSLQPEIAIAAAAIALAVTLGLGLAGTWRILSVKPAPYLRNL
jgi:putative ABC transport system permease protein